MQSAESDTKKDVAIKTIKSMYLSVMEMAFTSLEIISSNFKRYVLAHQPLKAAADKGYHWVLQ